jgi:hypothetical protein
MVAIGQCCAALCCAAVQMRVWLFLVVRAGPRTTPCALERSAAACTASVVCCQVGGEPLRYLFIIKYYSTLFVIINY